jgi:hypothetical protein
VTRFARLLRALTETPIDSLQFRPETEVLEAREVPSGGPVSVALMKTVPNLCYAPGSQATYTYIVTNDAGPGSTQLSNITLVDDNGTPGNPADDFTLVPGVNVAATDDNGTPGNTADDFAVTSNSTIAVGHSWTFQQTVTLPNVTTDTFITNTATVTAVGNIEGAEVTVTATATATVEVCVPVTQVPLVHGDTATIGFWHNKNGQALINSVNGGSTSTALATWLATNFPALYGVDAGANNLTGKTNADVAALFQKFFNVTSAKTNAQILGGALAVYVTDSNLAGNVAAKYGFNVTATGTGDATFDVGSNGMLIGLQNDTSYTVLQLLQQANADKEAGTFNAGAFNSIFDGINQKGDIT